MKRLALILVALAMIGAASAGDPAERMADPAQNARAHNLYKQLRCLICQNESIEDSTAPLAADLRRTVRERIEAGDSDRQVLAYMEARFTEFVLLKPPFSPGNLVLWLGPFAVLVIAGGAMALAHRRKTDTEAPLAPDEAQALEILLSENNAQIAPKIGRKKHADPS